MKPGPRPGTKAADGRRLARPGQVPTYNEPLSAAKLKLVLEICEAVANGAKITEFLGPKRDPHLPAWATFAKWQAEFPAIRDAYRTARELSAQNLEDRALGIAEGLVAKGAEYTGTFVQGAGKAMEQFRWSAERRSPGDFGTKAATQTIVPIQIITTLDIGQPGGGTARDMGNPFAYVVDETEAQQPAEAPPEAEEGTVEDLDPENPAEAPDPLSDPLAAKFGITETPRSAVPKRAGARGLGRRKTPLRDPETGELAPRPRNYGRKAPDPDSYVAKRMAEVKAERKG
jgi:hypothetical protein